MNALPGDPKFYLCFSHIMRDIYKFFLLLNRWPGVPGARTSQFAWPR